MRDPNGFWKGELRNDVVVFTTMYVVMIAAMAAASLAWTTAVVLMSGRPIELPLGGSGWDLVFVGGLFGFATAGYLAGAWVYLLYARTRFEARTVYEWLTLGPRVPVMTDMLCRLWAAAYRRPLPKR